MAQWLASGWWHRRSTFTEGAIMERAEYNRHSRARMAETAKDGSRHATPCNAGRAGAHRPSEALHPTRSSDVLPRIARERVPTRSQRHRLIKSANLSCTRASSPICSRSRPHSGSNPRVLCLTNFILDGQPATSRHRQPASRPAASR